MFGTYWKCFYLCTVRTSVLAIRVESREGQGFIDTAHLKTTFRGGSFILYISP